MLLTTASLEMMLVLNDSHADFPDASARTGLFSEQPHELSWTSSLFASRVAEALEPCLPPLDRARPPQGALEPAAELADVCMDA